MAKELGIRQRPPSRRFPKGGWEVRYTDPVGDTRRRTFATKQEAREYRTGIEADKKRGEYVDPRQAATPFREIAEDWYAWTDDLKPKTRAGYRYILDAYLLPLLGNRRIGSLTPGVLETFQRQLPGHLSSTTRRNIFRVVSPIFKYALREGMIRNDPTPFVRLPKAAGPKMEFLTAEQVSDLAEEVGEPHGLLIHTAAYTGLRAGELCALRVRRVDFLRSRIAVEESVSDVHGKLHFGRPKNRLNRSVAIPSFLRDALAQYLATRGETGEEKDPFLFVGDKGGVLRHSNWYGRVFKPAVNRLVDSERWPEHLRGLRFHDLRHTAVALLIDAGIHPKAISERLGHSSINVTFDIYGHVFPSLEEAIAERLDGTFTRAREARGRRRPGAATGP